MTGSKYFSPPVAPALTGVPYKPNCAHPGTSDAGYVTKTGLCNLSSGLSRSASYPGPRSWACHTS